MSLDRKIFITNNLSKWAKVHSYHSSCPIHFPVKLSHNFNSITVKSPEKARSYHSSLTLLPAAYPRIHSLLSNTNLLPRSWRVFLNIVANGFLHYKAKIYRLFIPLCHSSYLPSPHNLIFPKRLLFIYHSFTKYGPCVYHPGGEVQGDEALHLWQQTDPSLVTSSIICELFHLMHLPSTHLSFLFLKLLQTQGKISPRSLWCRSLTESLREINKKAVTKY